MNKVVLISLGTKLCHYRVVGTHSKYHCLTKYSKTISIISNADIQFQSCRNFYRKSVHLFRNIFDEVCLNTQEQNSDLQCDGCNVKISESVSMFQSNYPPNIATNHLYPKFKDLNLYIISCFFLEQAMNQYQKPCQKLYIIYYIFFQKYLTNCTGTANLS